MPTRRTRCRGLRINARSRLSLTLTVFLLVLPASSPSIAAPSALARLRECVERGDARCARALLSQVDPNDQNNPEYLDLAAETLLLERKTEQALPLIQHALEINPKNERYFITQGRIYQRLGNQTAAIRSFLLAEQLRPGSEEPVYCLGMSFFMLGNDNNDTSYYQRAAQHFRTALQLNRRGDRDQFMLGVIDAVEENLARARIEFEAAEKLSPKNPYYHLYDGIVLYRLGDDARALREMKVAEQLDPSNARTHLNLGNLRARMRNYQEARRELEAAARLDPRLSGTYYSLGRVYERLGLPQKSSEAFQKFQQMKSNAGQTDNQNLVEGAMESAGVTSHR